MSDNPIRVGIIGVHPEAGWAALAHVPALKQLSQYRLTAISHRDLTVARAAAAKFEVPDPVASAAELVAHPEVDLVVVAVKVMEHPQLVEAALGAGKAILCEWPLGTNLAEALAMREMAAAAGVPNFICLQARATPAFAYLRDLLRDDFIGRVTSATLVGSGILWGETMPSAYAYTLNPANGAGIIDIPFAHSIDALLHALGSRFRAFNATTGTIRDTIEMSDSVERMKTVLPDQAAVAGQLENGIFITAHFRGGTSQATNFHLEVNGSKGDIVVTSPMGYTGAGGFRMRAARGTEGLANLPIPSQYEQGLAPGITQSMALSYQRIASDMRTGRHLSPTFDDAVELHRLIDAISTSGKGRQWSK